VVNGSLRLKMSQNSAPVRCFHLTATVLSGEKHLTSAND